MENKIKDTIDHLSPLERKIIPFLSLSEEKIQEKTTLDRAAVQKALKFLENKGIVTLTTTTKKEIDLGINGIYYKKNHLPERRLILSLEKKPRSTFEEARKNSSLSENEFKAALGTLKKKGIIQLQNGSLIVQRGVEELHNKLPEETFIETLPRPPESLSKEENEICNTLKKRKDILQIQEITLTEHAITELGKELQKIDLSEEQIEEITPEVIKNWSRNKKIRKYDLTAPVPTLHGGKRHFVNTQIRQAKKIWIEMGFKEMSGPIVDSSFWVFDSLFTPQDHPAREMQDTFFIEIPPIPNNQVQKAVKQMHESGSGISKGWNYTWSEQKAAQPVLRTHTTSLTARTLSTLKKEDLPAKYFAIGKCFRNETVDWNHAFEFYQTEGIVVDESVTFLHLLGYLKEFYKKMGFEKIKYRPSFFAYTEPSVEIDVFHPLKKKWIEMGGAGMLRPEVTLPLFGKQIPVLAWGQGLDRIIRDIYKIQDIRDLYTNDLKILRDMPLKSN